MQIYQRKRKRMVMGIKQKDDRNQLKKTIAHAVIKYGAGTVSSISFSVFIHVCSQLQPFGSKAAAEKSNQ